MAITPLTISVFVLLLAAVAGLKNAGILIQVPSHLDLPPITVGLPFKIESGISIQKLELTDIYLRELDYSWSLVDNRFEAMIPEAVISFHWFYGEDSGVGTFT